MALEPTRRTILGFGGLVIGGGLLASAGIAKAAPSSALGVSAEPLGSAIQAWVPTGNFASSSFVRVEQRASELVPSDPVRQLALSAVRGGHASAQLAVTGSQGLERLRVRVGPLIARGQGVGAIDPEHIRVRFPEYISDGHGSVIADPLREVDSVSVPAGKVQPVWFTIEVPEGTSPGTYQTRIVLSAHRAERAEYDLTLNVADVTLPPPAERNFDLNVWFQPDAVADQLGLKLWSNEHFKAMQPYLRDLAEHGQRVINTAAIEDPWPRVLPDGKWRAQTYVPYHSLVDWFYDGKKWSFDFTHWNRFVEESLAAGVGPRISVFGLLGFKGNNHVVYTDTRTDARVDQRLTVGGEQWIDAWSAFLVTFEDHVRDRRLLNQTHLAFDERPGSEMQAAFDLVQKVAPGLAQQRFAIAGDEMADAFAYDLSLNYSSVSSWSQELIVQRRAEGKKTTFYTWNEPVNPNTLTQSAPLGARLLPWVSAKHNLDGYLRWSYNSWPEDPYTDPSFMARTFSSNYRPGDEYLIYPGPEGPVSSIRWELFRDGQEDFAVLDQLAKGAGRDNPVRVWALAEVNPEASPGPEAYKTFLSARAAVVKEIERISAVG